MKLNLGAGACPIEGYENLDRKTGQEVFPLPYADSSVEEVRASHILEHFSHRASYSVLSEWVRVLEPGGVLKIAVPNFDWIVRRYIDFSDGHGAEMPFEGYLMGGQVDKDDFHAALFGEEGIREAFGQLGLVDVGHWESEIKDCAALPVSLNLMGRKPGPEKRKSKGQREREAKAACMEEMAQVGPPVVSYPNLKGVVEAVMTMPRLCFSDNMFCAINGFLPLNINLRRSSGVFWGQNLTALMETVIDEGCKYVCTLDYDTTFTRDDVLALYNILEENNEIDAVMPMQIRRAHDNILVTVSGDAGKNMARIEREELLKPLLQVNTGHFGLTMLRAASFAKMPKPWFLHQPDSDGGWVEEKGKIDEDVVFWAQWRDCGNTFYQANRVVVGHLQMMCSWPDRNLEATHQYVTDYHKTGKPAEAWA